MKTLWIALFCCGVLAMAPLASPAQAALVDVNFDGPGYVAGEVPPSPWREEWGNTLHRVVAGKGYGGTQALNVGYVSGGTGRGVVYELPTPLTSDMGAVSISMLFKPAGLPSGWNFASEGGVQIGWGSKQYGYGASRGVIFQSVSGVSGIYGPGGSVWGTRMGSFTVGSWYEITFDIHSDWQAMTISAGLVGEDPYTMTSDWSGSAITNIWTLGNQAERDALYDNLLVTVAVPPFVLGDFNGDGALSGLDIPGFKAALADPDGWATANPTLPHPNALGDFNDDGSFSGLDIPGFKAALAGGAVAVPEPATALAVLAGALALVKRRRLGR